MRLRLPLALVAGLMAALPVAAAPVAQGQRLVMVDLEGCAFCAAFRREVMPGYAATPEGRAAPLAVVPFDGPWPDGIALAGRPRVTPTFILLRDGVEQARIEGYADARAFRARLRAVLAEGGPP